jgi:hypothetical protein
MAFPENTVNDTGIKHIWDKVTAALSGKVDKVSGKGLSTNDYTTAEKTKLEGIEAGAQVNTVTSVAGKTGAVTLDKTDVGLENVDNTSDLDKPISMATQTALNNKANADDIKGTQTVTGNPITITDAAPINAERLVVELEPKQDLHGYDYPWVGGAWKNKLGLSIDTTKAENPGSWNGNKITIDDGSVEFKTNGGFITECILNSAASSRFNITVSFTLKAGTYIYSSGFSEILYTTDSFLTLNDVAIARGNSSSPGQTFTLEQDSTLKWVLRTYDTVNTNVVVKPMIRLSTETDQTFAPYSNICPITGYDECEVDDVGKSLVDYTKNLPYSYANVTASENEDGTVQVTGTASTTFGIPLYDISASDLPSGQYIISMGGEFTYYANAYNGSSFVRQIIMTSNPYTINLNYADYDRVLIEAVVNGNEAYNKKIYPMIRKASDTDATFEPHHSSNATIQFGQTVYGGSVDLTTGVLTVDKGFEIFDGSNDEGWVGRNDNKSRSTSKLQGIIKNASSNGVAVDFIKSNMFKKGSADEGWGGDQNIIGVGTDGIVYTSTGETMSISDWTTYLVNNNLQICYELATPFTIQLTPQELKLLQDTNNLTTNGTTITLDYIPNNSIGDAVKASEEYTYRAVEAVEKLIPQKTVLYDDVVDVGDDFTISIPSSFNYIIFELTISSASYYGTGSLMVTSWDDTLNILATSHESELRTCVLLPIRDRVEVYGDFMNEHGELKITAF